MENRRGSGIFLGIVSIATLIVAIIGATFAYFSATSMSDPEAVNVTAYEYKLNLRVDSIYPAENSNHTIIPLDPSFVIDKAPANNNTNLLYAINVHDDKCVDDNGLQVCALYQVVIENMATNPVSMTGTLKTFANNASNAVVPTGGKPRTGFQNLIYQSLTGDHSDNTLALGSITEEIPEEQEGTITIADIDVPGATVGDDGELEPGIGTSYVLIYLNAAKDSEGNEIDQSNEMGASFSAQLTYTSKSDGANKLTGSFKLS